MPQTPPDQSQIKWISDFIWTIADNRLRDVYVRGKYRDVILPMTVLRRLDAVLEPGKQAVLARKQFLDKNRIAAQDGALRAAAGQAFYNTSAFTLARMGGKDAINDPRFIVQHAGNPQYSLLTRSSDGQLLFLVNKLAKIKHDTAITSIGSRIALVHNGSALFTGDARQGESNIRRYLLENDWLEAIIALPLNIFYNTGIATYIWILANKKPPHRKGKVQFIDAGQWSAPLRRNLGKKNCELSEADMARIMALYLDPTAQSRWFDPQDFGYWKLTVERPLRLNTQLSTERIAPLQGKLRELAELAQRELGEAVFDDHNLFRSQFDALLKTHKKKCSTAEKKSLFKAITRQDDNAAPVIATRRKLSKGEYF